MKEVYNCEDHSFTIYILYVICRPGGSYWEKLCQRCAPVAQLVEHRAAMREVVSSSFGAVRTRDPDGKYGLNK